MAFEKIIVDADICLKLGKIAQQDFLESLLPHLAQSIYIHQKVYEEIIWPTEVLHKIDRMIMNKKLLCVDEHSMDSTDQLLYQATVQMLTTVMTNPRKPKTHLGEIHSLAYAKCKAIPIFLTDERSLQPKIDRLLNTELQGMSIQCMSIERMLKQFATGVCAGVSRNDALSLWRGISGNIEDFNRDIWPTPSVFR